MSVLAYAPFFGWLVGWCPGREMGCPCVVAVQWQWLKSYLSRGASPPDTLVMAERVPQSRTPYFATIPILRAQKGLQGRVLRPSVREQRPGRTLRPRPVATGQNRTLRRLRRCRRIMSFPWIFVNSGSSTLSEMESEACCALRSSYTPSL